MDVNIEELLSSKRDLSEEEFNENPELLYLVGDYGFNIIKGKIFIADGWYILDKVMLDSRVNAIRTYRFNQLSYYNINFVDYIKNTKTKTLFNNCVLYCSPVADTVVEINTEIIFNNCINTNDDGKAINGYIFKKRIYLNNSNIDFNDCTFEDDFKCENANFDVDFSQSKFTKNFTFHLLQSRNINFKGALFYANASFKVIQKIESANFYQANFKNTVSFSSIGFGNGLVDFSKAKFDKAVSFYRCAFGGETKFNGVIFGGIAKFTRATFNNVVNFDKTNFKDESRFYKTQFSKTTILTETNFENKANFSSAIFNEKSYFTNAVFEADTDFSSVTFTDEARFLNADFKDTTTFESAEFKGKADFKTDKNLTFGKDANFSNTTFQDNAYFNSRVFEDFVDFRESDFKRVACFYGAIFKKPVNFSSIIFNGALNFVNAKTDFTYEELKKFIEDTSTNNIEKCISATNDFRDGFRLMKHALNNKGNALDASLFHRLELYCKELELEFTLENAKAKNNENSKEVKSVDEVEAKFKSKSRIELFLDLITLKLYRNTSDHHTNLLRIINFMALTIAVYGFSLYAYENFILTQLVNYSYQWTCFASVLVVSLALLAICHQAAKYNIAWKNMLIGFIVLALMSILIVSLLDIKYVAYIALFVTSYLLLYFAILKYEYDWIYLIYYSLLIVILFIKPFLIAPFISIFTSEQAIESKFKEYTIRYNENGLDDMLLDANLTNTKKDNKIDFIVENRKAILDELDDDKTLLNDFVEKSFRYAESFMNHNMSNKNIQKKEAPQKPYTEALAALKYDEIMQSIRKSANLLYGFIMLLVIYSLTKTTRRNSVVPS
ncbi:pentapeptide repeat-containing protein [Campylobacter concisus]|uniref:Pentapeptide repeat-containing protein n=1 Tax=Campylobacter concisus TaxID=199 RepID=A0A1Y5ND10_9BACT|nr:pentapeptide repeat-containing protein [Campylobacter concisus]OUT18677.1 hypothetical protein B9N61_04265 [Campylobacter concisus]